MSYWFAYISPTERCLLEDVLVRPTYSLARYHDAFTDFKASHLIQVIVRDTEATHSAEVKAQIDAIIQRIQSGADAEAALKELGDVLNEHSSDTTKNQAAADAKEFLHRAAFSNTDGMGIAWYNEGHPVALKSLIHPLCNPNFRSACKGVATTTCFGHLRDAALLNPREPNPVLSEYNCHPFYRGRFSFMHAGYVSDFHYLKRRITEVTGDEEVSWIKGNTDSEALAALFFTYLGEETTKGPDAVNEEITDLGQLRTALERTVKKVLEIHGKYIAKLVTPKALQLLWEALDATKQAEMTDGDGNPDLEKLRDSLTLNVIKDLVKLKEEGKLTAEELAAMNATPDPRNPKTIGEMQNLYVGEGSDVPHTTRYSDLNLAVTDGRVLICTRFRNDNTDVIPATEKTTAVENAPRLAFSTTAGQILNRKSKFKDFVDTPPPPGQDIIPMPMPTEPARDETITLSRKDGHGAHVIVASQRTTMTREGWQGLRKNEVVTFEPLEEDGENKLKMVRAPFAIDQKFFV